MRAISALLAIGMILILSSCGPQPAPNPIPARNPVEFTPETATVIRTDLAYETVQSAIATPRITENLSFEVTGTVIGIYAGMLDFVRQGEVLAEVDPADHLALIERSEISMQMLEIRKQQREVDAIASGNTLNDARDAYNTARRVGDRDRISRAQVTLQRAELNIELAKLNDMIFDLDYEKAHEAHDLLVSNLEKTSLVAPTDGYILFDANLAIGDIAEPRTAVFTFASTEDILLHITSREAIHFQGQENVNVTIDDKSYKAYTYTPVRGDTVWAANIPMTQTFLAFRSAPRDVPADSTVSVQILVERANALAVPRRSIRTIAGNTSVDVLDGDFIVSVPVELGIISGGLVEVLSGLSEGDIVIVG